MEIVNKNLRFLRENAGLTQKALANQLGVKVPVIGSYEEGRSIPPIPVSVRIAELFKISLDIFLKVDMLEDSKNLSSERHKRGSAILSITVDSRNLENIELVHQKVAAGYLNGYSDPEFIKDLPKIYIPTLPATSTYRGFEIQGDSMLPVKPGDVIIGRYIDNLDKIKSGKTYVVLSLTDGIVYKRVFKFLDNAKLLLLSDNRAYDPYVIDAGDVLEIWGFVGRVSFQEDEVQAPLNKTLDFLASKWFDHLSN